MMYTGIQVLKYPMLKSKSDYLKLDKYYPGLGLTLVSSFYLRIRNTDTKKKEKQTDTSFQQRQMFNSHPSARVRVRDICEPVGIFWWAWNTAKIHRNIFFGKMKTLICTRNILIKLNEWNKYVELIRFNWDDYVEDDSAHHDDANDDYIKESRIIMKMTAMMMSRQYNRIKDVSDRTISKLTIATSPALLTQAFPWWQSLSSSSSEQPRLPPRYTYFIENRPKVFHLNSI